ncbi:enoyl-CoA hydratase-related protein [Nocardiopsis potens]|uniref:enoyl-CoA hydratase-related protein n=1 Tax=Nocardiopsis potens TaxID=1246458 RepID=UPI000345CE31|nr:enoyl-CoA hydratase-related protein [Nocardiopsis potens]
MADAEWERDPEQQVLRELDGGVLVLTLNRPERLNAWTPAMEERLFDLLEEADSDPEVRAIVLTGAGRGFCAGADLDALSSIGDGVQNGSGGRIEQPDRPKHLPMLLRKPVVAAVNGAAAGLGLVVALFADVRFCAEDAKLTTSFSRRGLVAEYGVAWRLPRLVGQGRAMDLLLSSRVLTGAEAERIGLVEHVRPREEVLPAALDYARALASECSPASLAEIKAQVLRSAESGLDDSVAEAVRLMPGAFAHPDFAEGVGAYLERRPPRFAPLPPRRH